MVNRDSSGTLWVTSLVEDDVITVTNGNTTISLNKGSPTEVCKRTAAAAAVTKLIILFVN